MAGEKAESVHLLDMPQAVEYADSKEVLRLFELFFELKDMVNKKIAIARDEEKVIGSSLEANVQINKDDKYKLVEENLGNCLHQLFVVSKVEFTDEVSEITVLRSNGEKCNRCWNYVDHLNEGEICDRCKKVVEK